MSYDELYVGDKLRPLYRNYVQQVSRWTPTERAKALRRARASVRGDAKFLPLVRLMTEREYRQLVAGVRQRGRALQMFLHDRYLGDRSYERAGILTAAAVEKIRQRYEVHADPLKLRPENIQFWYAPDIIRDHDGKFRVIEDNVGYVGGIGDLEALAQAALVLGKPVPKLRHPSLFYRDMVKTYRREARRHGGGKTILLSYARSQWINHEDERFAHILGQWGIATVTNFRTLKVRDNVLFHQGERVGFVILNVKADDIEPQTSSSYRIPQFWRAVSEGKLGVSYHPGLEFIGDKKFYASVEALVEHYLNETCLLRSLPTLGLDNERSFQIVQAAREQWVIKMARGQSGQSVWVGRHLSAQAWTRLLKRVVKQPESYIAQRYAEPSQFLDRDVDLRPFAIISPQAERVSPIPWGRAARTKKSKTNISRGGLLAPVVVIG